MGTKFIKNTDDATIICKIPSDKRKVFVFKRKQFDKRNNILLSNGFTEISEEDMALLEAESNTFQYYMKSGKLSVAESLPYESMSTEQLIASLKTENAALKRALSSTDSGDKDAEIAQLKEALSKASEGDSSAEIEQLKKELDEKYLKEIEEMQNTIDQLTAELAEETMVEKEEDK